VSAPATAGLAAQQYELSGLAEMGRRVFEYALDEGLVCSLARVCRLWRRVVLLDVLPCLAELRGEWLRRVVRAAEVSVQRRFSVVAAAQEEQLAERRGAADAARVKSQRRQQAHNGGRGSSATARRRCQPEAAPPTASPPARPSTAPPLSAVRSGATSSVTSGSHSDAAANAAAAVRARTLLPIGSLHALAYALDVPDVDDVDATFRRFLAQPLVEAQRVMSSRGVAETAQLAALDGRQLRESAAERRRRNAGARGRRAVEAGAAYYLVGSHQARQLLQQYFCAAAEYEVFVVRSEAWIRALVGLQ